MKSLFEMILASSNLFNIAWCEPICCSTPDTTSPETPTANTSGGVILQYMYGDTDFLQGRVRNNAAPVLRQYGACTMVVSAFPVLCR